MREPTPTAHLYAWWRRAVISSSATLKADQEPRHEDDPQCGYYAIRKVKFGPWVPVHISCERSLDENDALADDERLVWNEANQEPRPVPIHQWSHCRPIAKDVYDSLMENLETDTAQATHKAVDLTAAATRPK